MPASTQRPHKARRAKPAAKSHETTSGLFVLHLAVYRRSVLIYWNTPAKVIFRDLEKKKIALTDSWRRSISDEIAGDAMGFSTQAGPHHPDKLVWLRAKPRAASTASVGCLVHEVSHAVDAIVAGLDHANLFFAKDGMSEPRAYLLEFVLANALHALKITSQDAH